MSKIIAIVAAATLALTSLAGSALAQAPWPSKPIRIIVPFAAGGGADIAARHLQPLLTESLGQPIVIENKGGGGGIVGTEQMVRSAPDGHTFGMTVSSLASNPALNKSMPFDALKDVKPVTILFRATNVWLVHPSSPYKSLAEIIAAAKASPGKIAAATSGSGTQQHLGLEQLKLITGVDITNVPYRGAGPALTDLLSGQIQLGILNISSTLPHVKEGRLRGIAVTAGQRSPYAPDMPSVAETVAGFDSVEWFGFIAPAGVPDDIIAKFYDALAKAARSPQFTARARDMGVDLVINTPAEFKTLLEAEVAKFADLVKRANIKLE